MSHTGADLSLLSFVDLGPDHAQGLGLLYGLEAGKVLVLISSN